MTKLRIKQDCTFLQRVSDMLRSFHRGALSYRTCAACRTAVTGGLRPLGLCRRCFEAIPWIRCVRCPTCGRGIDCGDCRRRARTHFRQNRSAVFYDETMKEWLALWKYRGDERLEGLLAGMLRHPYHLYAKEGVRFDWITFVPVSVERYRERGFNQAERLARGLGAAIRLEVVPMLERVKHTDKQSFKSRSERLSDLGSAFALRPETDWQRRLPNGRAARILLIDDVFTTGSTLNECARILTNHSPIDVYGLCWAR